MDLELRTNNRRLWIECLHEFASPELQRCWVTGNSEIVVSYVECMCGYFDDLHLGTGLDTAIKNGWLSTNEAEVVVEFHRLADAYEAPPGCDDAGVLLDPQWSEAVSAARVAWLGLRAVITDVTERQLMADLERRWGQVT